MTKERAAQLLNAIEEMKQIKKKIRGYTVLETKDITIDEPVEFYLKGIVDQGEVSHA